MCMNETLKLMCMKETTETNTAVNCIINLNAGADIGHQFFM